MSPWLNLNPREFEEFCYLILECHGFKNLSWHGKGGADKGRDIICTKAETPIAGVESTSRWLIQCKQYDKARLTKANLHDWLAACHEHHPDRVLLILSKSMSSSLKDWLRSISADYPFEIHAWEELDLRREYYRYGEKLRKRFPQLPKLGKRIRLYHTSMSPRYIDCEDVEEVGFYVLNDYGDKRTMEMVKEFVDFIKANEFKFDGLPN
jgi:hypothetical protein